MTPNYHSFENTGEEGLAPSDRNIIRNLLVREHGSVRDAGNRPASEREELVTVLAELFEGSKRRVPSLQVDSVRLVDAAGAVQRLRLIGHWRGAESLAFARERIACDPLRHVKVDPFGLRHLLSCGQPAESQMSPAEVASLQRAVHENRAKEIHDTVTRLALQGRTLVPDVTGRLRRLLLECACLQAKGTAVLAFELAVLDVRLFDEIGWETSRTFFALLAAIEPACLPQFTEYLHIQEIDAAHAQAKKLDEKLHAAHLDLLRKGWTPTALNQVKARVRMHAQIPIESRKPEPVMVRRSTNDSPEPKPSWVAALLGRLKLVQSRSAA